MDCMEEDGSLRNISDASKTDPVVQPIELHNVPNPKKFRDRSNKKQRNHNPVNKNARINMKRAKPLLELAFSI